MTRKRTRRSRGAGPLTSVKIRPLEVVGTASSSWTPSERIPDGMSSEDGVKAVVPSLAASEAKRRSIRRVPGGDAIGRRPSSRTLSFGRRVEA